MGLRQRQGTYKLTSSGTSFFSRGNKPNRRLKLKTRRTLRRCGYTGPNPFVWHEISWPRLIAIGLQGMQLWSFPKVQQPKACCTGALRTGPIIPSIHFIRIKYNTSKITVLNNPLNYCMKISSYLECIQHY